MFLGSLLARFAAGGRSARALRQARGGAFVA